MTLFETTYFGYSLLDWSLVVGLSLSSALVLQAVKHLLVRRFKSIAKRTSTRADDVVVDLISRTRFLFLLVIAFYFGSQYLELPPKPTRYITHLTLIVFLVQAALWGNRVIVLWFTEYLSRHRDSDAASATTMSVLSFIARVALWSILILMVLGNLGFNITTLVASMGIGGVAVALASQNILGDIFASLVIAMDKPFVLGDFLIIDDILGTVEYIGLKTTRLRSLGGEQIIFSNGDLLKSRIRNYKRMYERRVVFGFGVIYQTTAEQLKRIPGMVREIIEAQDKTRFDRAHFKEYGDSSLNFEVVYYVRSPDYNVYMDIQQAINLALFERFAAEGIEFAYPTRTLYLNQPLPAEGKA